MPVPRDPKAICYWCKCPNCFEIHIAVNHHYAITGTDWHKKDCPFVDPGGLYVTFNAHPVYSKRDKIFRKLSKKWQQFFIEQHEKRLKLIQTQK